uniref:Uncharacterized protein n=1 Tax=Arundo donax TaxID=35708 RepID=A0A0A9HX06_ARUDO
MQGPMVELTCPQLTAAWACGAAAMSSAAATRAINTS